MKEFVLRKRRLLGEAIGVLIRALTVVDHIRLVLLFGADMFRFHCANHPIQKWVIKDRYRVFWNDTI